MCIYELYRASINHVGKWVDLSWLCRLVDEAQASKCVASVYIPTNTTTIIELIDWSNSSYYIAQLPQMPSLQDLRNVSDGSCSLLIFN